jgi:probable phosphoglycerate mutase
MILLVRHGQTLFNAEGRLQGRLDSPLSEAGLRHARSLGTIIKALIDDAANFMVVSSPLGRAKATAEIICGTAQVANLSLDDRLAEVSFGEWDGLSPAEIDARWPGMRQSSFRESWALGCPGAESYQSASERAADWLQSYRERCVVAVTHGVMGSLIRGQYASLSKADLLRLPVPHDTVFALKDGHIEVIAGS